MQRVDHGGHRIQPRPRLDVVVDEERLRHRPGIGEPGGLDDDGVEAARGAGLSLHQPLKHADQVAAHRAADAAVVHLEDFFVRADDKLVVDADLAEFVDDDGVALAVVLREDAVEQGGLAGAEIAGQNGDGCEGHAILLGDATSPVQRRAESVSLTCGRSGVYHPAFARGTVRGRCLLSSSFIFRRL